MRFEGILKCHTIRLVGVEVPDKRRAHTPQAPSFAEQQQCLGQREIARTQKKPTF